MRVGIRLRAAQAILMLSVLTLFGLPWHGLLPSLSVAHALAATSSTISFQGRVVSKDRLNAPTGSFGFSFSLYPSASGGSAVWSEVYSGSQALTVTQGTFSVALGSLTPIPSALLTSNSDLYLDISFDSNNDGSFDQHFGSRIPLTAAPFAMQATNATTAATATNALALEGSNLSSVLSSAVTAAKADIVANGLTLQNAFTVNALLTANNGATVSSGLTVASGGATVTAGGLTVNGGGLTVNSGGLTLASSNALTLTGLSGVLVANGSTNVVSGSATTTDLPEGSNQYFTTTRARAAVSAASPLAYSSTSGQFSLDTTAPISTNGAISTTSTLHSDLGLTAGTSIQAGTSLVVGTTLNVSGTTTLATSLTGLLKASAGVISTASASTDYVIPADFTNFTSSTTGVTIGNGTGAVKGASPVTLTIQTATDSQPGLLSAADHTSLSGKVDASSRATLSGTANQVSVSGGTNAVLGTGTTLSLPQDIGTTSSPQFGDLTIGTAATPHSLGILGQGTLKLYDGVTPGTSHYVALRAPTSTSSNTTYTLPATAGANGQVLTAGLSDATQLYWSDGGGTGSGASASATYVTVNNETAGLPNSTMLSSVATLLNQSTPQTIGSTGSRLAQLWTTDLTVTNAIAGSVTGNAATVTGFSPTAGKTLTVLKTMSLTSADDTGVYTLPTGTATLLATNGSAASLTSFPTLNQDTTGTAAKANVLATPRTIGGTSFDGSTNITVASATGGFTVSGGDLTLSGTGHTVVLGSNDLTMTGSLGATGARLTKGWFTDLQVTNPITGSITGSSASTTGNAATATALATGRAIYGNTFDGTAALTQVIASTYGGTGNGFTKFSGATTTEKTYTLPDVSTTILTTNYTGALATGLVKNTTSTGALSIATAGSDYSAGTAGLATGILKSTTTTGTLSIAAAGDFPTLNQNTTGSAASFTGSLVGDVTGTQGATAIAATTVTGKLLTGYTSGAGTVAGTDTILQAIQKLNGNDATNANLTGPITSVGNATAVASQTGTGSVFVMNNAPTLVSPVLGAATYTTLSGGNITDSGLTSGRVNFAGPAGLLQDSANLTFDGARMSVGPNSYPAISSGELLQVAQAAGNDAYIAVRDGDPAGGAGVAIFGTTSGIPFVGSKSNTSFTIRTNNTPRVTVDTSGNVGIGTSSPSSALTLASAGKLGWDNGSGATDTNLYRSTLSYNTGSLTLRTLTSDNPIKAGSAAIIGAWPANGAAYAMFGHASLDQGLAGNYALLQQDTGDTYLNAASGRSISLRINNSPAVGITSTKQVLISGAVGSNALLQISNDGSVPGNGNRALLSLNNAATGGRDYRLASTDTNDGIFAAGKFSILDYTADATNGTPRLTIDSTGNVGVGTISPFGALTLAATNGNALAGLNIESTTDTSGSYLNSRRWQVRNDAVVYGDLAILQSTTKSGTSFAPKLYIDPNGQIGIGTTTPGAALEQARATNGTLASRYTVPNTTSNAVDLQFAIPGTPVSGLKFTLDNVITGATSLQFYGWNGSATQNTLRIDGLTGDVNLSGSNLYLHQGYQQTGTIHIGGNSFDGAGAFQLYASITNPGSGGARGRLDFNYPYANNSSWNTAMSIEGSAVIVPVLGGTGNRAVYSASDGTLTNSSSDARLKTNVDTLTNEINPLGVVDHLRGVYYNWIDTSKRGSQREIGMIAQEVQQYLPELIGTNSDGTLSLDYPKMTAVLVEATKQLDTKINTNTADITLLKGNVQTLTAQYSGLAALLNGPFTTASITSPVGSDLTLTSSTDKIVVAKDLALSQNLTVAGGITVSGDASFDGTVTVKGAVATGTGTLLAHTAAIPLTVDDQGSKNYSVLITWQDDPGQPAWTVVDSNTQFTVKVATPVDADKAFRYTIIRNQ